MSLPGGPEPLMPLHPVNNDGANNASTTIGNQDLETMKQEILREMRKEMQKIKNEIIDGM